MALFRRIANLFRRARLDGEISEELRAHIEMRIEDNIARGMTPQQARREALVRFGNTSSMKERVAAADMPLLLNSVYSDIRYAFRQLVRNPGFAGTAIVVLALGIGASTAIFAFVDAVLIKPLTYRDPAQLVGLFESNPLGSRFHLSYPDYLDWKSLNHGFSSMEAFDNVHFALKTPEGVESVDGAAVGAGFFRMLGVTPVLGRDFRQGEDTLGAPHTVMLSYPAWQKRFGGREDVLGTAITLDGTAYTIAGVLPRSFNFGPAGAAEFWTAMQASATPEDRGEHGILAFARLHDGVSLEAAAAEMSGIASRLAKEYPDADEGRGATVVRLTELVVGNLRPTLLLLLSGAALLLLMACTNVSGLLLVRAQSRQREVAVRGALGATRPRLVRQFATEAVVLTAAGGALSMAVAYTAVRLLRKLVPSASLDAMPYLRDLGLNAHVILFIAAIAGGCAVLLSLIAIARAPFANPGQGLAGTGRGFAGTTWRQMGAKMVVLQLCTATILLVGAGLFSKSFYRLLHTETGLHPDHLATMRLWAPPSSYPKNDKVVALAQRVIAETEQLPGVQSAAVTHQVPISNIAGGSATFEVIGRPSKQRTNEANAREVSAGYFTTLGARLLRGRWFDESDDASKPRVAIVNASFARKFLAGEDALRQHIRSDASAPLLQIVGIVDDIHEGPLDADVQPAIYTSFEQAPSSIFYIVVRTEQEPRALLTPLRAAVKRIDPNVLTMTAETMEDRIENLQSTALHRASAWLVGGFAAMALLLGTVGLYGVIAYSVSQRTREIGVRMALGAQRESVYRMILREAGWLTVLGVGVGLVCAVLAAMLIRKLLFGTQAWDAQTLVAVSVVMTFAALLASYLPARRAAAVNPAEALRAE
ncbi:ABC transporter permease [Occallatibacter riparius]|uniref:ABC transporter permease n=1 Tax=Occallatibacter riparius TaxID=1002689 RepID=A0A9J7BXU1_9BACT|nr:ABC transporter permease [Occallatibacter riparius]UWZ85902.1 ABC transporter permease [Occallatibacter riparius]